MIEFDSLNFPMLLNLPLNQYDEADEPWMSDKTYKDVDNFGSNWTPA